MPVFLCLIVLFAIWFRYETAKSKRVNVTHREQLLIKEREANLARKKDISTLSYLTIPLDTLPVDISFDSTIETYLKELLSLAEHPY